MLKKTKLEVELFAAEIWPDAKIVVKPMKDSGYTITVDQMYGYVDLTFDILTKISKFFDTENIHDSRYQSDGCETCDHGSSYEIELYVTA